MFSDGHEYSDGESDGSLTIHVHILYRIPEVGAAAASTAAPADRTGFAGLEAGDLCKKKREKAR